MEGPPARAPGAQLSTAVLCVWNDIDPEIEGEYEGWYQWDHLRDRVDVPGFRSCRRYLRVAGEGRRYFTFSDLDSPEVTNAPTYLERLRNFSDWTRRIMPHFRRAIRMPANVTVERGDGTGGFLAAVLYEQAAEERRTAIRRAIDAALGEIMQDACVTRVRVFEVNVAAANVHNPEAALRPDPALTAELAIVLEGSYEATVSRHLATLTALPELASLHRMMQSSVYRLLFSSQG
ncbi:hypothetical protein C7T35_21385 [Variovorax sp. WS11]|nr:hypothetical protein [Variovorax sp. WS11]PSL82561.1 hypothetical protein C7T35_21385 [Variovorax sp. WS11]